MVASVSLIEVSSLRLRCSIINKKLHNVEVYLWESSSNICVLTLMCKTSTKVLGYMALNALSSRDRGVTKAWLSFVENSYLKIQKEQAA